MTDVAQAVGWTREQMAARAAQDSPDGSFVNLGIGIPELVAQFVPEGREFIYHTENGLLGMGPSPAPGDEDPELINAGKKPVTTVPGSAFIHHADSFTMIRGGHIDVCVLGAMQVSAEGDLANWSIPGDTSIGIGGAMDLVHGAKRVIAIMEHVTKDNDHSILKECSYPVTGRGCVSLVVTDIAVLEPTKAGLVLKEFAPGWTPEVIQGLTEPKLIIADELKEVEF